MMTLRYADNDYLLPPPYHLDDMDVIGFWLSGKAGKIEQFIKSHLNLGGSSTFTLLTELPAQGAGQILGPTLGGLVAELLGIEDLAAANDQLDYPVLLTIHQIGRMYSAAIMPDGSSLSDRGYFSYNEAIFWVPGVERETGVPFIANVLDGDLPPPLLYIPLLIADEPLAVAGGREIFGLPKRQGEIEIPAALDHRTRAATPLHQLLDGKEIKLKTSVVPSYHRNSRGTVDSILDITFNTAVDQVGTTNVASDWASLLADIVSMAADLSEVITDSNVLERLIANIVSALARYIPVVALKQFRQGITDYGTPSYTSVNKMTYEINFHEGHVIRGLTIHAKPHIYPNISLTEMLGIAEQDVNTAFQVKLSGELAGSIEDKLS